MPELLSDASNGVTSPAAPPWAPGPTLADPALEAALDRDGYVVVSSIVGRADVEWCRSVWRTSHPEGSGFQADFEALTPADRNEIERAVAPLWERLLPQVLHDHRTIFSSFLTKWPGAEALAPHQDLTYVDERLHRSVVVWVALDDASAELCNGALQVLPGGHRLVDSFRGPETPSWYAPLRDDIAPRMVTVSVRAGDVVVMDNKLLHGSAANLTDGVRLALAGSAVPRGASLMHVILRADDRVDIHGVDAGFFTAANHRSLVESPPVDRPRLGVTDRVQRVDRAGLTDLLGYEPAEPTVAVAELGGSEPLDMRGDTLTRALGTTLSLDRRMVERWGRLGPGPVYTSAELPWLGALEAAWPVVREEFDDAAARSMRPSPMEMLADCDMNTEGPWDAVVLRDHHGWITTSSRHFPRTVAVLRDVPGLRTALFSVLGPGAHIRPHRGANKGVLRAHLGLVVPGPAGACHLDTGRVRTAVAEGRAFAFDDTFEHAARNEASSARVTLMLEFDRPLPWPAAAINRLVQRLFLVHPQVRGSHERAEQITAAHNPWATRP